MFSFLVEHSNKKTNARAGTITTFHGDIKTPTFIGVGTKGTIKSVTPDQLDEIGLQLLIANTYHLYLQPGDKIVRDAGGLHTFMNWNKPIMTDSGGFQVFSLGAAFGKNLTKVAKEDIDKVEQERGTMVFDEDIATQHGKLAVIDEEGVTFTSHIDGSLHRFTPERSIEIQHNLGADMIVAFDECTAATASHDYQKEAMYRTHRWAERSLTAHRQNLEANKKQALFGVVQGGRFEDLRRESAKTLASMNFDGFGIGGSYVKEDLDSAVGWVCEELPDDKPRHLLGIAEPLDLFDGVEKGVDLFDCVAPTRVGRTGMVYTRYGRINLRGEKYKTDFTKIDEDCECYTCRNYSRAYVAHLFRGDELLGATLGTIHNLHFIVNLMNKIRQSILDDTFLELKEAFSSTYKT